MSLVIPLEKEGCQKQNGPSLGPFFVGGVGWRWAVTRWGLNRCFYTELKSSNTTPASVG